MCSPSQSPCPLPSPFYPSGSSQCTSPEHLSHASNLGWSQPSQEMNIVWFPPCCVGGDYPFLGTLGWLFRIPKENKNNSETKYHCTFLAVALKAHFPISLSVIFRYPSEPVCVLDHSVLSDSLQPNRLYLTRLLCLWGFSRQGYWRCPALLQGIFPPRGSNPGPHIAGRSFTFLSCAHLLVDSGLRRGTRMSFTGTDKLTSDSIHK